MERRSGLATINISIMLDKEMGEGDLRLLEEYFRPCNIEQFPNEYDGEAVLIIWMIDGREKPTHYEVLDRLLLTFGGTKGWYLEEVWEE